MVLPGSGFGPINWKPSTPIRVKGDPSKALSWKQACAKLGTSTIQEKGYNDQRRPEGLNSSGVGVVQWRRFQSIPKPVSYA